MKTNNLFLSLIAAGLAGVIFASLGNVVFPEALRADKLMAAAFSIAILLFAVCDYARGAKALAVKASPLLRPALPVASKARQENYLPDTRTACAQHSAA